MNGAEKSGAELRQVSIKKTNAREPLMTCRKTPSNVETGTETLSREAGGGVSVYGSTGIRHEGGVIVIQAWVRNVGTCRPDATRDAQADSPRKRLSTEAGHRGGATHRRNEGSVMALNRRGGIVRFYHVGNPRGEDLDGEDTTVWVFVSSSADNGAASTGVIQTQ